MRALILILLAVVLTPFSAEAGETQKIVAIVGQSAISTEQVDERARLLVVSAGMPSNDKTKKIALDSLIDGQLKLDEAERLGIVASKDDIEKAFNGIAKRNGFTSSEFQNAVRGAGVDPRTLKDRLEAEIVWGEVVKLEIAPNVSVSQGEIDSALEQAKKHGKNVSRAGVAQTLLNARVEREAAQYLRRLRASTFIEMR